MSRNITKKYSKDEIMAIARFVNITDLPDDNRTGVIKVINPVDWFAIRFDLDEYEGKIVKIKFSAEVKRVGASGTMRWQINHKGYPIIGRTVSGANTDVWHKFSGEWTGKLLGSPPAVYLSTWRNDSERTTFYIDNVTLEITPQSK